ncbi:MAG: Lysyl-tRNA synthetase (class I), partial [uncultured Nocardioides sp.]
GARRTAGRSHRLGDAGGGRRRTARRRGQAGDRVLGCIALGTGPPGQPAGVPHHPLRGRRAAAPGHRGHPPARVGRLRPLPQGPRGRARRVGRAHRPPAHRRPRPVGVPRLLVRPLQGAAAARARRPRRGDDRDLPDGALPVRDLPREGPGRRARAAPDRGGAGASPHQEARRRRRAGHRDRRPGGRGARRLGRRRRRGGLGSGRPRALPLQALLPRVRPRHRHRHVVRRRDHRPRLHVRVRDHRRDQPRHRGRGQARVEGRLADALGALPRRLRGGRGRPRDARLLLHRRARARRVDLRDAEAGLVRLRVRGLRGDPEDVLLRGRRAHRGRRAAGARGADPALALRPTLAQAGLHRRLRCRGGAAVRRVGRPGPQGRRPRQAGPGGAGARAGLGRGRGSAPRLTRGRPVPHPLLGRGRDGRVRRADQPGRGRPRLPPRLGRRPPAPAGPGHGVDRLAPRRPAHHGPRHPRHRAARLAVGGRGAVAADLPRPAAGLDGPRRGHGDRLRHPQGRPWAGRRRPADRPGEGRPEAVLRAALPPAGRQGAWPTAAHPHRGAGRREGPHATRGL